jgi:hypothetical protein
MVLCVDSLQSLTFKWLPNKSFLSPKKKKKKLLRPLPIFINILIFTIELDDFFLKNDSLSML